MELLGWLNAASSLVTQPAARRRRRRVPKRVQVRQRVQIRHHFITQTDSNDPSRPRFEQSLPLIHNLLLGNNFAPLCNIIIT